MHIIGYLKYLFLSSLITLGACGCPNGNSPIALSNLSGGITAGSGWKRKDKCEWRLSPPSDRNHYKLRINITFANCKDKLKIGANQYCTISTPHTLYYVESESSDFCAECIESQSCFIYDEPLKISFENDKEGFSLDYQFESCTKSTPAPTETVTVATAEPSTKKSDDLTSVSTTPSLTKDVVISTVKPSGDATSVNSQNRTESLLRATSSIVSTPPSDSSTGLLVSIFVPLVIILAIAAVVLIIIIRMRTSKSKCQSDADKNPNGGDAGVYASIDNHAQSTGTAFGNQAYQTVLSARGGDSYAVIDDGAVYYSGVAGDESQNGANHLPPNTYEQVVLDVEVNEYDHIAGDTLNGPHNYDEVTLEVERQSTDEALNVNNVLYEDSRSNI